MKSLKNFTPEQNYLQKAEKDSKKLGETETIQDRNYSRQKLFKMDLSNNLYVWGFKHLDGGLFPSLLKTRSLFYLNSYTPFQ